MIFYFSGTGNSQFVAKEISNHNKDGVVSINEYIKDGKKGSFKSESPLVFVVPTYAWRIPKIVEEWICKSEFKGNKDAYFILTCGGDVGNASIYAEKLCKKIGLNYKGLADILMPENYLALFPTPNANQCQLILERSKPNIETLALQIEKNKAFSQKKASQKDRFLSGPINLAFYPLFVKDKGFTVNKACISCGKCSKNCPLNNVSMVDKKPVWMGNCTHCMACISSCPVEAIEYKNASKGRHRHYIMQEDFISK